MILPSQFFTEEYLLARQPDRPPMILFHFTTVKKAVPFRRFAWEDFWRES